MKGAIDDCGSKRFLAANGEADAPSWGMRDRDGLKLGGLFRDPPNVHRARLLATLVGLDETGITVSVNCRLLATAVLGPAAFHAAMWRRDNESDERRYRAEQEGGKERGSNGSAAVEPLRDMDLSRHAC